MKEHNENKIKEAHRNGKAQKEEGRGQIMVVMRQDFCVPDLTGSSHGGMIKYDIECY